MSRLFVIGNGFDLEHDLPTSYKHHFKKIAEKNEQINYFWDIYQSREPDIWSDFEHSLANPDFNTLEEIFNGYTPDYTSDYEHDRDAIIIQVDLNGLLLESLNKFAKEAEQEVEYCQQLHKYSVLFNENDLFVNFNYTHTLEQIYHINKSKILHIHGEIGRNNLLLGYPKGEYEPEKYYYDVRCKGRGPYISEDIEEHINRMLENESMDYYTYTAFSLLIEKTKSFSKTPQIEKLIPFLQDTYIDEIVVIGHSCSIDYTYFEYLNKKYPSVLWSFNPHDINTKENIEKLINRIKIKKYKININ